MRERTLFYSLPLRGSGTGQVQSAKSYLQHLSVKHHLTPLKLFELLLDHISFQAESARSLTDLSRVNLTGTTEYSQRLLEGLESTTGVSLAAASFGRLAHVLAPTNLSHRSTRVCLKCIQGDADLPYGRLLWDLQFVDACPIHETQLVHVQSLTCNSSKTCRLIECQKPRIVGVCATCGSIGLRCSSVDAVSASPEQVTLARCAEALLGSDIGPTTCSPSTFRAGLSRLLELRFEGSVVKAAREARLSRGLVCSWNKGARPGLPWLLQLCLAGGVDVCSILSGSVSFTAPSSLQASAIKRAYRRTKTSAIELSACVSAAARRPSPPSLTCLASQYSLHVDTLRARCPESCAQLQTARAEAAKKRRELQFAAALRRFTDAAEVLASKGRRVSAGTLQKEAGLTVYACGRSEVRERALFEALKQFGCTQLSRGHSGSGDADSDKG